MKKILFLTCFFCMVVATSGCSVVMATKQPTKKDTNMLTMGVSRSLVIAELGAPVISEQRNGQRYEIYTFTQGYSKASKIGRAFFHGAADVVTMGLWEILGTPVESAMNGEKISYEMTFDENDRLLTSSQILPQSSQPAVQQKSAAVEATLNPAVKN